jgi:hypothetical protein
MNNKKKPYARNIGLQNKYKNEPDYFSRVFTLKIFLMIDQPFAYLLAWRA